MNEFMVSNLLIITDQLEAPPPSPSHIYYVWQPALLSLLDSPASSLSDAGKRKSINVDEFISKPS